MRIHHKHTHHANKHHTHKQWSPSDFYFGKVLGEGLFGKVYFARMKQQSLNESSSTSSTSSASSTSFPSLLSSTFINDNSNNNVNDNVNNPMVAIKVIDKHEIIQKQKQHSIIKERKILSKLSSLSTLATSSTTSSSWTINFYMSFVDLHHLYMVMELGTGGTLHSLVMNFNLQIKGHEYENDDSDNTSTTTNSTSTSTSTTKRNNDKEELSFSNFIPIIPYIAGQILCALEYLHENYIYHCDIKPQNIVIMSSSLTSSSSKSLSSFFRIKLIDFDCAVDLSYLSSSSSSSTNTSTNTSTSAQTDNNIQKNIDHDIQIEFAGTADYTPPEVIKGTIVNLNHNKSNSDSNSNNNDNNDNTNDNKYDTRRNQFAAIDLWSYGCLLYFMFVSHSPFHTESDYQTMLQVLSFADLDSKSKSNSKYKNPEDVNEDVNEDENENEDKMHQDIGQEWEDGMSGSESGVTTSPPRTTSTSSIDWPDQITTNAKELILKLLIPHPFMRLGMNMNMNMNTSTHMHNMSNEDIHKEEEREGVDLDIDLNLDQTDNYKYTSIRQHDFFHGINWNNILQEEESFHNDDVSKSTRNDMSIHGTSTGISSLNRNFILSFQNTRVEEQSINEMVDGAKVSNTLEFFI